MNDKHQCRLPLVDLSIYPSPSPASCISVCCWGANMQPVGVESHQSLAPSCTQSIWMLSIAKQIKQRLGFLFVSSCDFKLSDRSQLQKLNSQSERRFQVLSTRQKLAKPCAMWDQMSGKPARKDHGKNGPNPSISRWSWSRPVSGSN